MSRCLSLLCCLLVWALQGACVAERPHILMILADDYGWADADWHRPHDWTEKATPHMMELIRKGIELDRHYAFKYCSPTRSAIQSGRNPIHVNVQNLDPIMVNREDPVSGYMGIPRNMTGLGHVMKKAGYATHFVGKWDVGMATPDHTPHGRGYDSSFFYFHHDNDYWTEWINRPDGWVQGSDTCPGIHVLTDLWKNKGPAWGLNGSAECDLTCPDKHGCAAYPANSQGIPIETCIYEDVLFADYVFETIQTHEPTQPLFLFWAPHVPHGPLQVPKDYLNLFNHVEDWRRQRYLAMVSFLDTAIANATRLLKSKGMYDDALIVFSSDNGGPIYAGGDGGANNFPLRGGKASNWEGGVRVNAWVSGGFIPEPMQGKKLEGLTAVWDWYATFAHLGGVDPTDHRAAAAGLPPVDGMNLWPYISGLVSSSPRKTLPLGGSSCHWLHPLPDCINLWGDGTNTTTVVDTVIEDQGSEGLWKLITGRHSESGWQGPMFPNASTFNWNSSKAIYECGSRGCLFRLDTDPSERYNLIDEEADRAARMLTTIQEVNRSTFSPMRGVPLMKEACKVSMERYKGFWGPFLDLEEEPIQTLQI